MSYNVVNTSAYHLNDFRLVIVFNNHPVTSIILYFFIVIYVFPGSSGLLHLYVHLILPEKFGV